MAIDILSFPLKALDTVCLFLSDKGLLQMRRMCKATKAVVDNLYCTQDPLIRYIDVFEFNDERVSITALFKRPRHSLLWKLCVLSAKSQLNLKNLAHFRAFESEANIFDIVESIDDAIKLLAHLKQSLHRTKIKRIQFKHTRAKILKAFEDFLGEMNSNIVEMTPKQGQIDDSFYCLLRNCQVEQARLTYTYSPSQECYNSLIRIASIVITLTISMSGDNVPMLPLYLIHDVLNRKCKNLCMIGWNCKYSRQEIIKLIQILHTLDKEISFTGRIEMTSDSETDETIGLYSLAGRGWYTEINHLARSLE